MNADPKQLYEKYILSSFILQVLSSTMAASNISIHDSQQLSSYNESLLLMLNYVKGEIDRWTSPKYSRTTMAILLFIHGYAEKTVLIPNLIKVGCVEIVLKCLTNINQ